MTVLDLNGANLASADLNDAMTRPTWADGLLGVYACDEGIAALAEVIGDLDAPMPCDWPWALAVLSSPGLPTAPHVGWGVGRLVCRADVGVVAGADLRDANLPGANLAGANLAGTDLRGAQLARARLRGASLRGASLRWATLCWADLAWTNLTGARLAWADLAGADLTGADLAGADLAGARRAPSDPSIPGWIVVDGRLAKS